MTRLESLFVLPFVVSMVACGIDLADGTERVPDEEDPTADAGATADAECEAALTSLQEQMRVDQFRVSRGDGPEVWVPDLTEGDPAPSSVRRRWVTGSNFDDLGDGGWAPPQSRIQASYRLVRTDSGYAAQCVADVDEDGVRAIWMLEGDDGPRRITEEGIR